MKTLLVALLVSLGVTSTASPAQQPYVAVIGCSNSTLIGTAYLDYSTRDAAWVAGQGGATLALWATTTPWTTMSTLKYSSVPFDQQLAQRGQPSAVWYPLCIKANDYPKGGKNATARRQSAAWHDFLSFYSLLRQRTSAQLYVTDTLGEQTTCTVDDRSLQQYVVDRAVGLGYALRSSPDIPPASYPATDNCHFDPALSTNVGQAAAAFIDG